MRRLSSPAAALAFLSTIVAANVATATFGMVPVGFGLLATAGTFAAGLSFVLRDLVHDTAGRRAVLLLIIAGAGLSVVLSTPALALASGVAFLLSEVADYFVYTPLRRQGYVRAAIASNVVGAVVDTAVFLALAGFPILASFPGQLVGKLSVTAATVAIVLLARGVRRSAVA
jgi:queuosine precursor transporter